MQESAKTNPELTTRLLDRLAAAGFDQEPHWKKLLQQWNDKLSAAAWLQSKGIHKNTSEHLFQLLSQWEKQAPNECQAWIDSLPSGEFHDLACWRFANFRMREDPAQALAVAATIGDTTQREKTLDRIIRDWPKDQLANAQALLAKLDLPENEKQGYLGKLAERQP